MKLPATESAQSLGSNKGHYTLVPKDTEAFQHWETLEETSQDGGVKESSFVNMETQQCAIPASYSSPYMCQNWQLPSLWQIQELKEQGLWRVPPYQLPTEDPTCLHTLGCVGVGELEEFVAQLLGNGDMAKAIDSHIWEGQEE